MPSLGLGLGLGGVIHIRPVKTFETVMVTKGYTNTSELKRLSLSLSCKYILGSPYLGPVMSEVPLPDERREGS